MNRFFVEHVVDTPMSFGSQHQHQEGPVAWHFNIPNRAASIHIFDNLSADKPYGIITSNGLRVHMYLDAEDLDDAVRMAKDITEVLLSTLSFASLSECPAATWRRAYDATPELETRRYRQFFDYRVPGTMQQVLQRIYTKVFEAIDPLPDERIIRAMTWFRKGLSQTNVYDELIHYWSALENLDGLLEAALPALPYGFTNTNRGKFEEPRNGKGMLRFFVRKLHYKPDAYWKLKNTRNDIVHGKVPLSRSLTRKVHRHLPMLRRSCIAALCHLLGIESATEKAIADQLVARGEPFSGCMEVDLVLPTIPPLEETGKQPYLDFPPNTLKLVIKPDGGLNVEVVMKIGEVKAHNATLVGDKIAFGVFETARRSNLGATHKRANGTTTQLQPRSSGKNEVAS